MNTTTPIQETIPEAMSPQLEFSGVRVVTPHENFLGSARVVIGGAFVINDLRIMQGENGIYAGMPGIPDPQKEGEYRNVAYPITPEARAALDKGLGEAYILQLEKEQTRLEAARAKQAKGYQPPEKKPLKEQMKEAKKQADKDNAARLGEEKGNKVKGHEHSGRGS